MAQSPIDDLALVSPAATFFLVLFGITFTIDGVYLLLGKRSYLNLPEFHLGGGSYTGAEGGPAVVIGIVLIVIGAAIDALGYGPGFGDQAPLRGIAVLSGIIFLLYVYRWFADAEG